MRIKILPPAGLLFRGIFLFGLLAFLTVSAGGCVQQGASFELGFGTNRINGVIDFGETVPDRRDGLIVILKYHYTFLPRFDQEDDPSAISSSGSHTHPTAHVLPMERDGVFSVSIPTDVVSVFILFVAADRETDLFRFSRSLGIGDIHYQARLVPVRGWRNHFYTYLEPQLKHLIVETRYGLSSRDQQILTTWLDRQMERLGPVKGR